MSERRWERHAAVVSMAALWAGWFAIMIEMIASVWR